MANWTSNTPQGSTHRKKWNLEGLFYFLSILNSFSYLKIKNPDRSSLNNLKYHFAEDGCSEVQYNLARQLLEDKSGKFNLFLFFFIPNSNWL